MGVRNRSKEGLARLAAKTLDARFLHEIQHGLNCSPFEAEAVLQVVKEVYLPFLDAELPMAPPGKITLIAVSAEEPAAGSATVACHRSRAFNFSTSSSLPSAHARTAPSALIVIPRRPGGDVKRYHPAGRFVCGRVSSGRIPGLRYHVILTKRVVTGEGAVNRLP